MLDSRRARYRRSGALLGTVRRAETGDRNPTRPQQCILLMKIPRLRLCSFVTLALPPGQLSH